MKTPHLLLAALAIMAVSLPSLVHGQGVIVASPTAPSTSSPDITNFVNNGVDGNDYSDRGAGQTFTTGADASGYLLGGVTVQGGDSAGNGYQGATFTLAIYSVSGTALTNIGSETFTFPSPSTDYSSDYLTLNLATPVALAANTEYAFAFTQVPGGGYYGFTDSGEGDSTYAGGFAFNMTAPAGPGNGTIDTSTPENYDKSFALQLSDAPEPSTWAMMLGGIAVFGILVRFRKLSI